jgi:hypothetical protein
MLNVVPRNSRFQHRETICLLVSSKFSLLTRTSWCVLLGILFPTERIFPHSSRLCERHHGLSDPADLTTRSVNYIPDRESCLYLRLWAQSC